MTSITPAIRQHFARQAEACRRLGSPFTADLLTVAAGLLARDPPPAWAAPLLNWPGDPAADALALRLAGAVHRVALDGDAELAVAYAARRLDADHLDAVLARHTLQLGQYLLSPPQTNDPLRAAILLGGFRVIAAATGLPLALREIGASAGINLLWDAFAYDFGSWCHGDPMAAPLLLQAEWQGPPAPDTPIVVHSRAGCDLRPLDARDPEQRKRLLSYIWADQWPRLERVAMALDHAGRQGRPPEAMGAGDFVIRELANRPGNAAFVLYHSIVWQYVDAAERQRITDAMTAAGAAATPAAPVAWLRFEPEDDHDGADLSLTLWPGDSAGDPSLGSTRRLAVADYHGRWIRWAG